MNMRHFTAIGAVVSERSFSKAASKLFLTQQALSKTIHEAEEECGRELFVRSKQGAVLTPEGQRLYSIIKPLLEEYELADHRVERFLENPAPNEIQIGFAVGAMYSLGYDNCIELQKNLRASFPEFSFTFTEGPDLMIEDRVESGTLDFAVSLQPWVHKDLMFNSVLSIPLSVLLPEDHPMADRDSIRLEELKDFDFIMPSRDMQFYEYTIRKCLDAGFRPKIRHECVDASTAMYLVRSGEGVFLGISVFLQVEGIKKIRLEGVDIDWVNGILYTKNSLKDQTYARVLRVISDSMRHSITKIRSHENVDIIKWYDTL